MALSTSLCTLWQLRLGRSHIEGIVFLLVLPMMLGDETSVSVSDLVDGSLATHLDSLNAPPGRRTETTWRSSSHVSVLSLYPEAKLRSDLRPSAVSSR